MDSNFRMICNTTRIDLCVRDDQGRLVSTMTSWRQPCMNVKEGEACGLLTTYCFVATMNFNHVVFELDCKIVIEKINTTC